MKKIYMLVVVLLLCNLKSFSASTPEEGMWLPLLIERLNYADMQHMGLKLTPAEIYDINQSCMKDAVVGLDEAGSETGSFFCTAEVVSGEGLIFTNHHCGFSAIQKNSTVDHDYITNGFWAMDKKDELPNMNLQASFLVRMEDVTAKVLEGVTDSLKEQERSTKIASIISRIRKDAEINEDVKAVVKSFYGGNEYYLFIYRIYRDVRLVGAPPSSIGNFGGDTDNWMWPRHTGDFSIFRIYADANGKPADYSPQNVPLKVVYHLPISLNGYQNNDFTMVMGYPGTTDRYLTSSGIRLDLEKTTPLLIRMIGRQLEIWKKDMQADKTIQLKYAAKYEQNANAWKDYLGESKGIRKRDVINRKKIQETAFQNWAIKDPARNKKYGYLLQQLDSAYSGISEVTPQLYALSVGLLKNPEAINFAKEFFTLYSILNDVGSADKGIFEGNVLELREKSKSFYRDFNPSTDVKVLAGMFELCRYDLPKGFLDEVFNEIDRKYKGNYLKWAEKTYRKSIFSSKERVEEFLSDPDAESLRNDPLMKIVAGVLMQMLSVYDGYSHNLKKIEQLGRIYMLGLMEMNKGKAFYPDANSTMRLSYGKVTGYDPADAIHLDYFTTLKGIIEKEDSANPEFTVPPKLKDLFYKSDFGPYAVNGDVGVCFITDNDISGGNSGSPVLNAKGELIGLAFDGNWEAMSSDLVYEPTLQRTICVDIRYVLFVIDKVAGAGNLIRELTIR